MISVLWLCQALLTPDNRHSISEHPGDGFVDDLKLSMQLAYQDGNAFLKYSNEIPHTGQCRT